MIVSYGGHCSWKPVIEFRQEIGRKESARKWLHRNFFFASLTPKRNSTPHSKIAIQTNYEQKKSNPQNLINCMFQFVKQKAVANVCKVSCWSYYKKSVKFFFLSICTFLSRQMHYKIIFAHFYRSHCHFFVKVFPPPHSSPFLYDQLAIWSICN